MRTDTPEAVARRRANADAVGQATPRQRAYRALLHVQIDLQEAGDEAAEDALLDALDCAHARGLLTEPAAPAPGTP